MRAAIELESEATKIRNLLSIVLKSLEDAGMVTLVRDPSGQITGMNYKLVVDSIIHSQSITSPNLNKPDKEQNP